MFCLALLKKFPVTLGRLEINSISHLAVFLHVPCVCYGYVKANTKSFPKMNVFASDFS